MGIEINGILRKHSEKIAFLEAKQNNVENILVEIREDIKEIKARPYKRLDSVLAAVLGALGGLAAKAIWDTAVKLIGG
ncbi:MAG: hypothetical protein Q8O09_01055 [Bacillota bacterium]|nr:hypothetical protein [Bacillota bacterium]